MINPKQKSNCFAAVIRI